MAQAATAREVRKVPGEDAAVALHLLLVHQVARQVARVLPPSIELDDLVGWGTDGLLDALRRFDDAGATSFRTYARIRIRGAILDGLRGLDWLSRTGRDRATRIEEGRREAEHRAGRAATDEEVAVVLGRTLAELHRELGEVGSLSLVSLDDPEVAADRVPAAPEASDPAAIASMRQRARALRSAIDRLPGKERDVLPLYYGGDLTMKQVGIRLGITESRVCQLHGQAIVRLRAMMTGWAPERVAENGAARRLKPGTRPSRFDPRGEGRPPPGTPCPASGAAALEPGLRPGEIDRVVHPEETRAVGIEARQCSPLDRDDAEARPRRGRAEVAASELSAIDPFHRLATHHGGHRLPEAVAPGRHDVGRKRGLRRLEESTDETGREKRKIAGDDQHEVGPRGLESRGDPGDRPEVGGPIA